MSSESSVVILAWSWVCILFWPSQLCCLRNLVGIYSGTGLMPAGNSEFLRQTLSSTRWTLNQRHLMREGLRAISEESIKREHTQTEQRKKPVQGFASQCITPEAEGLIGSCLFPLERRKERRNQDNKCRWNMLELQRNWRRCAC